MTKRETIDRILRHNQSARPEFLARFRPKELQAYLRQLESLEDRPYTTNAPRTDNDCDPPSSRDRSRLSPVNSSRMVCGGSTGRRGSHL